MLHDGMAGRAKAKSRVEQGERVGLQVSLFAHPQTRFLPLPVFVLIALWGCAGLPPTPQREWVMIKTSSSVQYYSVRGTTTGVIFDDIKRNGLFDNKGRRAVGLTSGEWSIDWKRIETRGAVCSPESMTILLNLVVTLPQLDQLNDVSQGIRTNWQRFAASVAAHEQRHVDIYLNGAKTMKTRMDSIIKKSYFCSELENVVRSVWASQQAETERAQDEFHLEDEARIQNNRKPLQDQIDINQTRLTTINSEFRSLDQTLDDVKRQRDTTHVRIDAVKAEMAKSGASPPKCSQARLTSRIQALCQEYKALVAADNALVDQHNGAASRRNNLADEHNRVVAVTNGLIEAYNWTQ
jgi:predicted secreted Zn-dependent protease